MEKKPSIDPGILAPIVLGVLSTLGMIAVFFINRANVTRPVGEIPDTETPFRYIYLGTEPGISTLTPEPTATPILIERPDFTDTPDFFESPSFTDTPGFPGLPFFTATPSVTSASTNADLPTQPSVRTPTPTATSTIQSVLAKYDDTHYGIIYDGEWTAQANVADVYQNTLHISFAVENYAYFPFVGQQVVVGFQAGPSLGSILIDIDGVEFTVSQSNSQTQLVEWRSPTLVMGSHEIIIEHLSGGSVNIDSITIPDLRTPTATLTPTP